MVWATVSNHEGVMVNFFAFISMDAFMGCPVINMKRQVMVLANILFTDRTPIPRLVFTEITNGDFYYFVNFHLSYFPVNYHRFLILSISSPTSSGVR